jgi:hypothetical protein
LAGITFPEQIPKQKKAFTLALLNSMNEHSMVQHYTLCPCCNRIDAAAGISLTRAVSSPSHSSQPIANIAFQMRPANSRTSLVVYKVALSIPVNICNHNLQIADRAALFQRG